ncbi:MAG: cupin domain-containing protein [Spirochaetes bacterium]|nr:cupin domain-containing protein [Spirochaetota bacterium]
MNKTIVVRNDMTETVAAPWGGLTWYASGKLGNSTELTVGRCVIKPGMSNPLHFHPNCTEILIVLQGTVMHTTDGGESRMDAGDTITVQSGFTHHATNIGNTDAVLFVVFPTPDRKVENE